MKYLREFVGQPMSWSQTRGPERLYELRAGAELLATLTWQKVAGSLALAEAADGKWTFKRVGFFSPRITVRAWGEESDMAAFTPDWLAGRGTLEFAAPHRFRWATMSFWRSHMAFCNEAGQPLVHYKPEWGFQLANAKVELDPVGATVAELPILVLLGWYFMILTAEDAVMTSVIATSVVASA